jgi:hypothetical protein
MQLVEKEILGPGFRCLMLQNYAIQNLDQLCVCVCVFFPTFKSCQIIFIIMLH